MLWWLSILAYGQGLDASGLGAPPSDGLPASSAWNLAAPRLGGGQLALGAAAGLELGGLIRTNSITNEEEALVDQAVPLRLGVMGMALPWFGASAALPIRAAAHSDADAGGPALGDASARLWFRTSREEPVLAGLSVGTSLPTGDAERFAGAGRVVPDLTGSVSSSAGPWIATASLGMAYEGGVDGALPRGGAVARAGLDARWASDTLGLGASLRTARALSSEVVARRGMPVELGADLVLLPKEQLSVTLGGMSALSSAAGSPNARLQAGIVGRFGEKTEVIDPASIPRELVVTDPDGIAVPGALATFRDGSTLRADASGRLVFDHAAGSPILSAPGLQPTEARRAQRQVALDWSPVLLHVTTTTESGLALRPKVVLSGPTRAGLVGEGDYEASLVPGTWTLRVGAEGYGTQTRIIEVQKRRVEEVVVEVVLLPVRGDARLALDVADPQGLAVGGAEVRLDGVAVGTIARGTLDIDGLPSEKMDLVVESRYFRSESQQLDLTDGSAEAAVALRYEPGTVRVTAVGPTGPIADGTVFVDGPRSLSPLTLGPTGEKLIQLSPGEWDLLLSSPAHGLQERRVALEERGPTPVVAAFSLMPEVAGEADLIVHAVDGDGRPLADVSVTIDGAAVGTTSTSGELRLFALPKGAGRVDLFGPGLLPFSMETELRAGLQSLTIPLDWEDGATRVAAHSAEGPVDALVQFLGPSSYPEGRLGPAGRRLFREVPSGEWEILASHVSGMEVAWAVVGDRPGRLTDVEINLSGEAGDASMQLSVLDPEGEPVEGAEVWLDGVLLASTASSGRLKVSGLRAGARQLVVKHPWFADREQTVELGPETVVRRSLRWASGLVALEVRRNGEPVTDAVAYFAGPDSSPIVELGSDGSAVAALGPGEWELMVSSPSAGLAERVFRLSTGAAPPKEIALDLSADGVAVRVVDRRRVPVPGVELLVGGVVVATTDRSGSAVVPASGEARIELRHVGLQPREAIDVQGRSEVLAEVRYLPRTVKVRVSGRGDAVNNVSIAAHGPDRVEPFELPEGRGVVELVPGRWELVASAGQGLGAVRRFVQIPLVGEVEDVEFAMDDAQVQITAQQLTLLDVQFGLGSANADAEFAEVLEEVAATIVADPSITRVELSGHTDSTGTTALNFDLSRRRALSIRRQLEKLGVPPDLLSSRGYGPSRPIDTNETEEGRARNRRVDFRVVTEP